MKCLNVFQALSPKLELFVAQPVMAIRSPQKPVAEVGIMESGGRKAVESPEIKSKQFIKDYGEGMFVHYAIICHQS